jgi:hypothetical protein
MRSEKGLGEKGQGHGRGIDNTVDIERHAC